MHDNTSNVIGFWKIPILIKNLTNCSWYIHELLQTAKAGLKFPNHNRAYIEIQPNYQLSNQYYPTIYTYPLKYWSDGCCCWVDKAFQLWQLLPDRCSEPALVSIGCWSCWCWVVTLSQPWLLLPDRGSEPILLSIGWCMQLVRSGHTSLALTVASRQSSELIPLTKGRCYCWCWVVTLS